MTGLAQLLFFVNIFFAAIVAGGQVVVLLVIIPVKRLWETRQSVQLHNAMLGHQIDRFMKPSGILSIGAAGALLLFATVGALPIPAVCIVFTILGMLGGIGVVITSRFFNVEANAMMASWSLDAIPDDYPKTRDRWDRVHTIRTSCGVLSLTFHLIARLTV